MRFHLTHTKKCFVASDHHGTTPPRTWPSRFLLFFINGSLFPNAFINLSSHCRKIKPSLKFWDLQILLLPKCRPKCLLYLCWAGLGLLQNGADPDQVPQFHKTPLPPREGASRLCGRRTTSALAVGDFQRSPRNPTKSIQSSGRFRRRPRLDSCLLCEPLLARSGGAERRSIWAWLIPSFAGKQY